MGMISCPHAALHSGGAPAAGTRELRRCWGVFDLSHQTWCQWMVMNNREKHSNKGSARVSVWKQEEWKLIQNYMTVYSKYVKQRMIWQPKWFGFLFSNIDKEEEDSIVSMHIPNIALASLHCAFQSCIVHSNFALCIPNFAVCIAIFSEQISWNRTRS